MINLPDEAESIEALQWIGYTNESACREFTNWTKRSNPYLSELVDFATGWTGQLLLPSYQELSPEETLTKLGICQRTSAAILAAKYPGLCKSQDFRGRIDETLYLNWLTLLQLQRKRRDVAVGVVAQASPTANLGVVSATSSSNPVSFAPQDPEGHLGDCLEVTLSATSLHCLPYTTISPSSPGLLPGHTLSSATIGNIRRDDVHSLIQEEWLLVLPDGRKAEQYCFKGVSVVQRLAKACKGKVHIEITTPVYQEGNKQ